MTAPTLTSIISSLSLKLMAPAGQYFSQARHLPFWM
jgi:hypothetical protein